MMSTSCEACDYDKKEDCSEGCMVLIHLELIEE
jgi:hypothetical protein